MEESLESVRSTVASLRTLYSAEFHNAQEAIAKYNEFADKVRVNDFLRRIVTVAGDLRAINKTKDIYNGEDVRAAVASFQLVLTQLKEERQRVPETEEQRERRDNIIHEIYRHFHALKAIKQVIDEDNRNYHQDLDILIQHPHGMPWQHQRADSQLSTYTPVVSSDSSNE